VDTIVKKCRVAITFKAGPNIGPQIPRNQTKKNKNKNKKTNTKNNQIPKFSLEL
jgi:hypothetical protein